MIWPTMRSWIPRAAALAAVLALLGLVTTAMPVSADRGSRVPPTGTVSWVSLGDSYGSGEGIANTGGTCSRSDKAYGPYAARLLAAQRAWRIGKLSFPACTGAVTADLFTDDGHQPPLAPQVAVADREVGRSDVITLSTGGNDIGFSGVLIDCIAHLPDSWDELGTGGPVQSGCTATESELNDRIDSLMRPHQMPVDGKFTGRTVPRMADVYKRIAAEHLTDRGVLVVSGYPRIFQPSSDWPAWRGNSCQMFTKQDADLLGSASERLDETLAKEVRRADPTGKRIVYESRLDLFDDAGRSHSLCGRPTTEWLNGIALGLTDGSLRWLHSFHPNEPGHAATAEAVATLLEGTLGRTVAPTTTTTTAASQPEPTEPISTVPETTDPPIRSGGRYDIGDSFEADCTIAWPTAPTRLSDSISMTTTCTGVPGQFLFVDVQYGDPDLPVTSSRARMRVKGQIADIAQNEYGYKYLVVLADDVTLY